MPAPFKWTSEQIQDMVASYEQGESVTSIATRYGTSQQVIGPVLKRHGVRLRSHNETMRRHTCNHAYFHRIDTEEKAYWLGFLTADGCITTGDRVTVNLATVDCGHLFKLRAAFGASQTVSRNNHSCSLTVCSPEMAADLAGHGLLPNKTFSTRAAHVPSWLARHYWRGVLDGDGHFPEDGSSLTLVGDYDVVHNFQDFVLSLCSGVKAKIHRRGSIYAFSIRREATPLVLRVLYGDAGVFLDRKYERARRILGAR